MPFLVAAVALIGVVTAFNLLLSYGIIRRLREQNAGPAGGARRTEDGSDEDLMLADGERPRVFDPVVSTQGDTIAPESLKGATVAFFSPECKSCKEESVRFAERVGSLDPGTVLVVAVGGKEETADLVSQFEGIARVVVEPDHGPIQRAFAVRGSPALAVLDDEGRVVRSSFKADALPPP